MAWGLQPQPSKHIRGRDSLALRIELDSEFGGGVLGRADENNFGTLVVEEVRRVERDKSPPAKALTQLRCK